MVKTDESVMLIDIFLEVLYAYLISFGCYIT